MPALKAHIAALEVAAAHWKNRRSDGSAQRVMQSGMPTLRGSL